MYVDRCTKGCGLKEVCMLVVLEGVRGQLVVVGPLLLPCGPWDQTDAIRRGGEFLHLLCHLADPNGLISGLFEFFPFCICCYCMRQGLSRAQAEIIGRSHHGWFLLVFNPCCTLEFDMK